MKRTRKRSRTRLSWPLVRWAIYVAVAGFALVALAWVPASRIDAEGLTISATDAYAPLVSAGVALVVAGLIFLILALVKVRLPADKLPPARDLIVRAASAMVVADGDAAEVEVQALRTWVSRRFDYEYDFDELFRLSQSNKDNRAGILRAVELARSTPNRWGPKQDKELLEACKYIVVADLRVRDDELKYLRELSELLEEPKERIDENEKKLKAIKHDLVTFVVEHMLDEPRLGATGGSSSH